MNSNEKTETGHRVATLIEVLTQVANERDRQDERWGGPGHDDTHDGQDWVHLVEVRCVKALQAKSGHAYRERMVQVAALAVAAVQSFDRKPR